MALNGSSEPSVKVDLDATVIAELHDAQKRGIPLKAIAFDADIKPWRLYEIYEGKARASFAEAARLMAAINSDGLLHALAQTRGAMVFRVRPVTGSLSDIHAAMNKVVLELGDVARTNERCLDDGDLTADEAEAIAREVDELISAGAALKDLALRKARIPEVRR
jgi:hypothetical protein